MNAKIWKRWFEDGVSPREWWKRKESCHHYKNCLIRDTEAIQYSVTVYVLVFCDYWSRDTDIHGKAAHSVFGLFAYRKHG